MLQKLASERTLVNDLSSYHRKVVFSYRPVFRAKFEGEAGSSRKIEGELTSGVSSVNQVRMFYFLSDYFRHDIKKQLEISLDDTCRVIYVRLCAGRGLSVKQSFLHSSDNFLRFNNFDFCRSMNC